MKMASIQVKYDDEKLNAMKQYMERKEVDLDVELTETLQKLYEKHVPQAVREYIDSREEKKKPIKKQAESVAKSKSTEGI